MLPTGKTSLKGTGKLGDLKKSKLLNTFDFSAVKATGIGLTKADSYDFYNYLNIIFDANAKTSPQKILNYMTYSLAL